MNDPEMETQKSCPECSAAWEHGVTCQDHFHQMLFWESENPDNGAVHHLMVLCYHLQHPSLYSPEGLRYSVQLLADFLERGLSTEQVRKRSSAGLGSDRRAWKVKAGPASSASYKYPVQWSLTAADVVAGGAEGYCERVREWARSVHAAVRSSGNFPAQGGAA